MTPPNPSEAAREAADKIFKEIWPCGCKDQFHDENEYRAMTVNGFSEIIQSALDSALAASAARVKELEDALHIFLETHDKCVKESSWVWHFVANHGCPYNGPNYKVELDALRALSIKVGETKP